MLAVQAIVTRGTQAVVAILLVLERDGKGAKVRPWGKSGRGQGVIITVSFHPYNHIKDRVQVLSHTFPFSEED